MGQRESQLTSSREKEDVQVPVPPDAAAAVVDLADSGADLAGSALNDVLAAARKLVVHSRSTPTPDQIRYYASGAGRDLLRKMPSSRNDEVRWLMLEAIANFASGDQFLTSYCIDICHLCITEGKSDVVERVVQIILQYLTNPKHSGSLSTFAKTGGVGIAAAIVRQSVANVINAAAWLLAAIAEDDENRSLILSGGAIPILRMMAVNKELPVRQYAAITLMRMSTASRSHVIQGFCEAGGIDAIAGLLSVKDIDDTIVAFGIGALEALAKSEHCDPSYFQPAKPVLMKFMNYPNPSVQLYTLRTLTVLNSRPQEDRIPNAETNAPSISGGGVSESNDSQSQISTRRTSRGEFVDDSSVAQTHGTSATATPPSATHSTSPAPASVTAVTPSLQVPVLTPTLSGSNERRSLSDRRLTSVSSTIASLQSLLNDPDALPGKLAAPASSTRLLDTGNDDSIPLAAPTPTPPTPAPIPSAPTRTLSPSRSTSPARPGARETVMAQQASAMAIALEKKANPLQLSPTMPRSQSPKKAFEVQALFVEVEQRDQRIQSLKAEVQNGRDDAKKLRARLSALQAQLDEANRKERELQDEVKRYQKYSEDKSVEIYGLEQALVAARIRTDEMHDQLTDVQVSLEAVRRTQQTAADSGSQESKLQEMRTEVVKWQLHNSRIQQLLTQQRIESGKVSLRARDLEASHGRQLAQFDNLLRMLLLAQSTDPVSPASLDVLHEQVTAMRFAVQRLIDSPAAGRQSPGTESTSTPGLRPSDIFSDSPELSALPEPVTETPNSPVTWLVHSRASTNMAFGSVPVPSNSPTVRPVSSSLPALHGLSTGQGEQPPPRLSLVSSPSVKQPTMHHATHEVSERRRPGPPKLSSVPSNRFSKSSS
eukprot:TRINITY_DN123_c0_g2_i3.p1 TRINITY_DN123_c0_g2~~TRINITY_DN123_c0_g2_i3.p1  ORF type:complete len:894 (+),score=118.71 TRINITY_DN123_c0_g2_i3:39-2684(+)